MLNPQYEYIAYIDEAGDPGLKKVKPLDKNGASEWLILSGVLIRRAYEPEVSRWNKDLLNLCGSHQTKQLHFRKLKPAKQIIACEYFSELPVRAFVVASNKKNMKGHRNPFADAVSDTLVGRLNKSQWFYYWLSRILLEKMSDYAYRHSVHIIGEPQKMKIEFSHRGGLRYNEIVEYYRLLSQHDRDDTQHIKYDGINWEVIDRSLIDAYPHHSRAGLVLPDIVASSFFTACDREDRGKPPDPRSAFKLDSRMARRRETNDSLPAGYGVKLMPSMRVAALDAQQARIFKHYGYR